MFEAARGSFILEYPLIIFLEAPSRAKKLFLTSSKPRLIKKSSFEEEMAAALSTLPCWASSRKLSFSKTCSRIKTMNDGSRTYVKLF